MAALKHSLQASFSGQARHIATWCIALYSGALAGCSPEPIQATAEPVRELASLARPAPHERPLRIAISGALASEAGVSVYEDISHYLAMSTGQEIEFVTGLGQGTINEMLESGVIDAAFVCGLAYVLLHDKDEPAVELLAAPVMALGRYRGEPTYYAALIVRKGSDIHSLSELRGRTYVFSEQISNAGYNMPRYHLIKRKLTGGFFGKVLRSGSDEESIRMVALGQADASFVGSVVLDDELRHDPSMAERVRVLESLGPSGIPPMVVSTKVPAPLRQTLKQHLLFMHEDQQGREILKEAKIARFADVDDAYYDDIRMMQRAAREAHFLEIR